MFWILAIAFLIVILDFTGFKLDEETQNIIYSEDAEAVPDTNEIQEKKPKKKNKNNENKTKQEKSKSKSTVTKPKNDNKTDNKKQPNPRPSYSEDIEIKIDTEDIAQEAVDVLENLY